MAATPSAHGRPMRFVELEPRHRSARAAAGERGIFLPLFAVIILSILFVIIVVGIDTTKTKLAQVELRSELEIICQNVAANPTNQTLANEQHARSWSYALQNKHLKYSTVKDLHLIVPTMPKNGSFKLVSSQNAVPSINRRVTCPDTIASAQGGVTCRYSGTLTRAGSEEKKYPDALWDNARNAGNAVGCEATASVNTFLSGEKEIEVKSVWWKPVRGIIPAVTSAVSVQNSPGLTIAIGTQITTNATQPRFRFISTNAAGDPLYSDEFRGKYDPLAMVQASANSTGLPPSGFRAVNPAFRFFPNPASNTNRFLLASTALSPTLGGGAARTPNDPTQSHSNGAGEVFSDLEEMSVACANPLTLVRNVFLAVIVEMASRHGQLRNMTEILHLNSRHAGDLFPSPPTQIGGLGDSFDLSKDLYQLPYVFHFNDNPSTLLGAWVNPFQQVGALPSDPRFTAHDALVASQLRICYHLFRGAAGNGLERYGWNNVLGFLDNAGFEPVGAFGYKVRPYPAFRPPRYQQNQDWDQRCPWGAGGGGNCSSNSRALNAAELVSALGTTQDCPYQNVYPDPLTTGAPLRTCVKNAANPLRADLTSLINYLTRPQSLGSCLTNRQDCALAAPGIFPLTTLNSPRSATPSFYPMAATNYIAPQSEVTSLLLVLHQTPDDIEANQIENLIITQNRMQRRPITIAFFPASAAEHNRFWVFRDAFRAKVDLEDSDFPNALLLFSPFAPEWGSTFTGGSGSCDGLGFAKCEDEIFAEYWHFLLTDAERGIARLASSVFLERLLSTEIKF